jgi:hypothetical protein
VTDLLELGDGVQALLVSVPLLKKPDANSPRSQPKDVKLMVTNNRQRSNLLPFHIDKLVDAGPPGQVTRTMLNNLQKVASRFGAADWEHIVEVEARNEGIKHDDFDRAAIADYRRQIKNVSESLVRSVDEGIKQMPPANEQARVLDSLIAASLLEEAIDVALKMPLEPVNTGVEPPVKPRPHYPHSHRDRQPSATDPAPQPATVSPFGSGT